MTLEEMDSVLLKQKDMYMERLFNFLKIKSISTDSEAIRQCAGVLKTDMEALGIDTRIMETSVAIPSFTAS